IDSASMHGTGTVRLGCTDCHGGNAGISLPAGAGSNSAEYEKAKLEAHPRARKFSEDSSANPIRPYASWMQETLDYVKFVNPGDLRAAPETCGRAGCHVKEVRQVRTSMMTTGPLLWGAALYNNGAYPIKDPHFGHSYSPDGKPQRVYSWP